MNTLTWVFIVAGSLAALVTLPGTIELLSLSFAGLALSHRREWRARPDGFKLAVVVPAHNEEGNIAACVRSIQAADQIGVSVVIAVVADNCDDRTAEVASQAGARVLIRSNIAKRGKGYALDYAFSILQCEHHDGLAVVDADSVVSANFLTETCAALREGAQATQCRYLVRNSGASTRTRLMNVALLAFNVLRPLGRDHLGLSAGIYGNGFALSAATLAAVPYTAASVVEDLEFHIALVRAGRRVRFLNNATVYAEMPVTGAGVTTQRTRWEGGRFRMLAENAPSLIREILKGQWRLIEPCLDLILLPLGFHVLLLGLTAATPVWYVRDIGVCGLAVVLFHLFAAIVAGHGTWRDVAVLGAAPIYILWKVLLLPSVLAASARNATWVRTARAGENKLP